MLKLNNSLYVLKQASADVFGPLKNGLLIRGYHQYQVDPCIFYKKYSVNLTYVEGCVIVSYKQDTITSLIESLNNSPGNYVLTDEVDISNDIGGNIKKNSYGALELLQLHLVEKIINHVRLTASASLKSIETPAGKPLFHKDESSQSRKCICNYRSAVGILSYLQGSTIP